MKSCAGCGRCATRFVFVKSARDQCRVSGKLLRLDLTVPDSVVEEWISVGTVRAKEKVTAKPPQVVDWTFAERSRR